jgi:hypothetical protein
VRAGGVTQQLEQSQGRFAPSSARYEDDEPPVAAKDLMLLRAEVSAHRYNPQAGTGLANSRELV